MARQIARCSHISGGAPGGSSAASSGTCTRSAPSTCSSATGGVTSRALAPPAGPHVAAVARAQPESTLAVGADATELAPLHGQAAGLGKRIPVHPVPPLLRSALLAAAATLGETDAIMLRGNSAVTTGYRPGIA